MLDGPWDKRLPMNINQASSQVIINHAFNLLSSFMCYIITISGGSDALEPSEDKWGDGAGVVVVECHHSQSDDQVAVGGQGIIIYEYTACSFMLFCFRCNCYCGHCCIINTGTTYHCSFLHFVEKKTCPI